MLVFCQAWEGMYQGLHGIETIAVIEVSDNIEKAIKEINEWGNEASEDLIYTYGLEDEYFRDFEDEDYEYDDLDITESYYYSDRGWRAWKVRDDVALSERELDNKCCRLGADLFVEEYCEKEIEF